MSPKHRYEYINFLIGENSQELDHANPDVNLIKVHLDYISKVLKMKPYEEILPELHMLNILDRTSIRKLLGQMIMANRMQAP